MSQLNPRQRAAIRHVAGPLLVLAGAGSGKTRVISHKIAHLIADHGLAPRHIAAVTFTNKAAREMRERVNRLRAGTKMTGLRVSTFHTLGLDIIRRELSQLGLRPGFSIYDQQDSADLLGELMPKAETASRDEANRLLWRISGWKNRFVTPEQALTEAGDAPSLVAAARAYGAYERALRTHNAVDFDDLIIQPAHLLRDSADTLDRWRDRIRYLLVDEYQDTNAAQYALVKLLVGERGGLTVVGDDDQSIYAWRGAQPENLALLGKDFPTLRVVKLEQNYRSSGAILQAANALIANNSHVFKKNLWSELGFGDPLRVIPCRNAEHEAERVVSEIMHRRFQQRSRNRDFAILYRGNHQSRLFERLLREHNIPYRISGGNSFFAFTEVKDVMAYLRLLTNPDDDNAFLRVVNTPRREIGAASVEKLAAYASERGVSLFAASFEPGLEQRLGRGPLARVHDFGQWLVELAHRARHGDPVAAVHGLIEHIDYEGWLRDTATDEKSAERRMENVRDLLAWLERLRQRESADATLGDLVAKMALLDILERQDDDQDDADEVQLMTLHAAKGLEFEHVFMVGMEEALLPHRSSLEADGLEEERRLAYVGLTRAQRTLTFTYAQHRSRYGETIECQPSRFLSELPAEVLDWKRTDTGEANDRSRGNAYLASLRTLLTQN